MNLAPLRSLLAERDYVIYITGNAVSLTGTWIQRITVAWLVWELTQSPLWVGLAAAADLVPMLIAALLGGVLADRLDRPRFIFFCQLVSAAITLGLGLAHYLNVLTLPLLIALRVCLSASIAIVQPARMALISELVGRQNLSAAVSFGAVVFNVARAIGPALAGGLIAFGGFALALATNSLTYLAMAVSIFLIRRNGKGRTIRIEQNDMLREMAVAYHYVGTHTGFRPLFLLLIVFVLTVRAVEDLLPAFVDLSFGGGIESVATLTSLLGVGSIVGGIWASGRAMVGLTRSMILAGAAYAACAAGFAASASFPLACVLMTLTGFFTVQFGTAAQSLVQTSAVDSMRGRVMSLWFITLRGGPGLGALFMGGLAEVTGLSGAFLVGSGLCLLVCAGMWVRRQYLARVLEVA